MGFTAGLYVYDSYKGADYKQVNYVNKILEYKNNEWAQKNYATEEEYLAESNSEFITPTDKETIDWYLAHTYTDEFGYEHLYRSVEDWCSNGQYIYDIIKYNDIGEDVLDEQYGMFRTLSKDDIINLLYELWNVVNENTPEACSINYAYKYIDTEGEEDQDIRLMKCDGVELVKYKYDQDGNEISIIERYDSYRGECFDLFVADRGYDDSKMNAINRCITALLLILRTVDFDNQFVMFEGGW